jgi:hypothetical protein
MIDGELLATVVDYAGLHSALRKRADDLGISRETLGDIAGTHGGHVNKILADPPQKNAGITTFGLLLQALGLKLLVVEDAEQMEKLKDRLIPRNEAQVRMLNGVEHVRLVFTRRHMRRLGRKSAAARMRKISPERRKEIAAHAARVRWKPRVPRRKPACNSTGESKAITIGDGRCAII